MTLPYRIGTPATQLAAGTQAATGPTDIISSPGAGKRIVIVMFQLQNESATATTMTLLAGGTQLWRCLGQNQGDGCGYGNLEIRLNANTALRLQLSGANSCGYSIGYYIENSG